MTRLGNFLVLTDKKSGIIPKFVPKYQKYPLCLMSITRLFTLLAAVLLAISTSAQVRFNGQKAAVDSLTGTWLLSIPQAAFGSDYTADVLLEASVTYCSIDGQEVTDSYTFSNVQPGATYRLLALTGSDTVKANIQFTYWPVIQIYGTFIKRPYSGGTVIITDPDSCGQEPISARVRWAGSSTA